MQNNADSFKHSYSPVGSTKVGKFLVKHIQEIKFSIMILFHEVCLHFKIMFLLPLEAKSKLFKYIWVLNEFMN